jgi:hypothetical protein
VKRSLAYLIELPGGPRRLLGGAGPLVVGVFSDAPPVVRHEWLGIS